MAAAVARNAQVSGRSLAKPSASKKETTLCTLCQRAGRGTPDAGTYRHRVRLAGGHGRGLGDGEWSARDVPLHELEAAEAGPDLGPDEFYQWLLIWDRAVIRS